MKFSKTTLADAMVIDMQRNEDARGFFARTFCVGEFADNGLVTEFVQGNHSYNRTRGTVRGMHFQTAPHGEVKLVRCVAGAVLDIIIDLRAGSPTYLKWEGFELSAENGRTLYVPGRLRPRLPDARRRDPRALLGLPPLHPRRRGRRAPRRPGLRHHLAAADQRRLGEGPSWPPVDLAAGIRI